MSYSTQKHVPLFGALCVAEGLITQEQLEACLLLQQEEYPWMLLGQILVRYGRLSEQDVERVLKLQQSLRARSADGHGAQPHAASSRSAGGSRWGEPMLQQNR